MNNDELNENDEELKRWVSNNSEELYQVLMNLSKEKFEALLRKWVEEMHKDPKLKNRFLNLLLDYEYSAETLKWLNKIITDGNIPPEKD